MISVFVFLYRKDSKSNLLDSVIEENQKVGGENVKSLMVKDG